MQENITSQQMPKQKAAFIRYLPFIIVGIVLVAAGLYLEFFSSGSFKDLLPQSTDEKSNLELTSKGTAPEFTGISTWLNSKPLTMESLRGKVVLVDFWTYSCINCIRTLPYITSWHEKYAEEGLVIVGVHTPEFAFEKVTANVETALARHNINYPVAQDNDFMTWRAYSNRFWPAKYLINQDGQIVYTHFGEGKYEETESAIRILLGLESGLAETTSTTSGVRSDVRTPEIYFGSLRLEAFSGTPSPAAQAQEYSFPEKLSPNNFSLSGQWQFAEEYTELFGDAGSIGLNFYAGNVFIVAEADQPVVVEVYLDGVLHNQVTVEESKLYTLVDGASYGPHILELRVKNSGLRAFTFTFG